MEGSSNSGERSSDGGRMSFYTSMVHAPQIDRVVVHSGPATLKIVLGLVLTGFWANFRSILNWNLAWI